jgi:hypothetical protein
MIIVEDSESVDVWMRVDSVIGVEDNIIDLHDVKLRAGHANLKIVTSRVVCQIN